MMPPEYLPFDRNVFAQLYRQVRRLPVSRTIECAACSRPFEFFTIQTHADCPECGQRHRTRGFGAYDEIEDLASIFVLWAAQSGRLGEMVASLRDSSPDGIAWDTWDEYFEADDDNEQDEESAG